MQLQKTLNFLIEFRKITENSNNKKYLEKFIRLLNELNLKEFDDLQQRKLDAELQLILQNFEIEKNTINVKRELKMFLKFLRSEMSMTIPWYYTSIGTCIGLTATVLFGFPSILLGLLIGGLIGYFFDEKANKRGNKIRTELNEFIY